MISFLSCLFISKLKVDGGWGTWSSWTECPVSCGSGEIKRNRTCDNPAPQHGGDSCTDSGSPDSETKSCNDNPCVCKLTTQAFHFDDSLQFLILFI